jgi:two-component system NtrC family response regulator
VLAQGLHDASKRKGRFVAINCAAIPETLLESELFGYEKGAFTGATKSTIGKIETANGGTLMLDEIGDLPMPLQAKLLRFLQERVIERVGGRQEIHRRARRRRHAPGPEARIADGRFREDLYYRLAEIVVEIPPLRGAGRRCCCRTPSRAFATDMRRPVPTLPKTPCVRWRPPLARQRARAAEHAQARRHHVRGRPHHGHGPRAGRQRRPTSPRRRSICARCARRPSGRL